MLLLSPRDGIVTVPASRLKTAGDKVALQVQTIKVLLKVPILRSSNEVTPEGFDLFIPFQIFFKTDRIPIGH